MDNNKYVLSIESNDIRFQQDLDMSGWKVSLEKLSYDKGIYRPAEIIATLNVGGKDLNVDKLTDAFYQKRAKLSVDGKTVAENYIVFKVRPVFRTVSSGSSVKLELTICSHDKVLTLDKYSKAWTGRKLGEYVFANEMSGLPFKFMCCRDLQVVTYNDGEFIQPYLVQYNESFYDFMRRTSNRCGEFLYHEDGKLHLGMTMNDKATDNDPDYARLASERYYETIASEGLETHDYTYDYMQEARPEPEDRPYSNPLTYDDYLSDIGPKYTSFDEQIDFLSRNVLLALSLCLEGTSLAKILANIATTSAFKIGKAFLVEKNLEDKYNDVNLKPWDKEEVKKDQMNGDKLRQFGTAKNHKTKCGLGDKDVNMNGAFYALVREAEKKVGENAVYLEFGQKTQDLRIGDKIKVDGTPYVVIGVKGACDLVYKSDKTTERVEPTYEESQQVIGVKLYGDAPIPPALPDTVIRDSQPQLAFVEANLDPMKIGRVRLKFAWQKKDDDASPWVRVSLPFATDAGGVKFKPEKGDEVMVSFEEGNIERPYVSGFLLSPRSNKSWSYLPDRGITSKNGHNITFNDGIDGASFYYSFSPFVKLVRSYMPNFIVPAFLTDNMDHRSLTGGMTLSDRYGMYRINMSSDSRSVAIQSAFGDVTLSAFTGITISAPNGDVKIIGKNVSIQAGDTVTIESGLNVKERFFSIKDCYSEEGMTWQQRGWMTFKDWVTNMGKGLLNRTLNKVVDLQLIRTGLDLLLKPIDGTTKIKSSTFVKLEAGKGSAEYPRSARKEDDKEFVALDFYESIDLVASTARSRIENIQKAFNSMCAAIQAFNDMSGENGINQGETVITFDAIRDASYQANMAELQFNWPEELETIEELRNMYNQVEQELGNERPNEQDDQFRHILGRYSYMWNMDVWNKKVENNKRDFENSLAYLNNAIKERNRLEETANNLATAINGFYKVSQVDFKANVQARGLFEDTVKTLFNGMTFLTIDKEDILKNTTENVFNQWDRLKTKFMRTAVYNFITTNAVRNKVINDYVYISTPQNALPDLTNNETWETLIGTTVKDSADTKLKEAGVEIKHWAEDYLNPVTDPFLNRKRWRVGMQGKILLSDDSERTVTFGKDSLVHITDNATFTNKSSDRLRKMLKSIGTNVK